MVTKDMSGRPRKFTDEDLLQAIKDAPDPFCTANELAEQFDVSNSAMLKRLDDLEEAGEIESKEVGARAKVWWIETDS